MERALYWIVTSQHKLAAAWNSILVLSPVLKLPVFKYKLPTLSPKKMIWSHFQSHLLHRRSKQTTEFLFMWKTITHQLRATFCKRRTVLSLWEKTLFISSDFMVLWKVKRVYFIRSKPLPHMLHIRKQSRPLHLVAIGANTWELQNWDQYLRGCTTACAWMPFACSPTQGRPGYPGGFTPFLSYLQAIPALSISSYCPDKDHI